MKTMSMKLIRTTVLGAALAAVLSFSIADLRSAAPVTQRHHTALKLLADDGVETHGKNPPKPV